MMPCKTENQQWQSFNVFISCCKVAGIREQLLIRNDWETVASAQRKQLSAANARLSISQTRMKALVDAFEQSCGQSEKEEALVRQTPTAAAGVACSVPEET